MHGVRRGAPPTKQQLESYRHESAHAADLIRRALALRRESLHTPVTPLFLKRYAVVEAALRTNPDEYTLWAFRREVLLARTAPPSQPSNPVADSDTDYSDADNTNADANAGTNADANTGQPVRADNLWKAELTLTMRALQHHPKAYPAWQHRVWLLESPLIAPRLSSRGALDAAIDTEHNLTSLMLSKDARNFHGWAHRMRVRTLRASRDPRSAETLEADELAFVDGHIRQEFANYSAWHHRSVLLPRVKQNKSTAPDKSAHDEDGGAGDCNGDSFAQVVRSELTLARQAFYTEPDVQSVWFYHRWLLAGAPGRGIDTGKVVIDSDVLRDELAACDDLLELEPEARHALQARAHILMKLGRHNEATETLDTLKQIDPMRSGYYGYLQEKSMAARATDDKRRHSVNPTNKEHH